MYGHFAGLALQPNIKTWSSRERFLLNDDKARCEICKVTVINMSKILYATLASCIATLYRLRNCEILGSDRSSNLITPSHSVGSIP